MKVEILDFKNPENRTWFLCKGNLLEYLKELKNDFYDYIIQRKIVKNQYLDYLLETIKHKDPIPIITLTYKGALSKLVRNEKIVIDFSSIEILDGLQRTFRLWAYLKANEVFNKQSFSSPSEFAKKIKEKYNVIFETGVVSLGKIKKSWSKKEFGKIESYFENYDIYFSIWVNLPDKKVIEKMLQLNAGQKSVSKTHQFELLFLYIWDDLKESPEIMKTIGVKLYREKDTHSNKIKRGEREIGEFIFSSVVVSLQSFVEGSPQRVSIEDLFIPDPIESKDTNDSELYENIFDKEFIRDFLKHLKEIDNSVNRREPNLGKAWFVKDTTLSGIMAGMGKFNPLNDNLSFNQIEEITNSSFNTLKKKIDTLGLNLISFQEQYNVLSSRSVNIGNFIRKVIMNYTFDLMSNTKSQSWEPYFQVAKKKDEL